MTEEKQYQITYTYSGHAELVEEFDSLDEAIKYFDEYLASGEEQPPDDGRVTTAGGKAGGVPELALCHLNRCGGH